jgi:oligoendopeptidase F
MSRSFCTVATLVLVLQLGAAQPARPASPPSPEPPYDWDLESQYPNEAAWSASLATVHERLARLELLRSVPIASIKDLADRLDEVRFLRGQAGRMARFAILHTQLDDTSQEAKARLDAATALEARVEAGVSWIDAAMLDLGTDRLKEWAAREPRLRAHGWRINRVLSEVSHLPPKGAEAAVASLERAAFTPANVYEALMQADLGWPAIKTANGSELRIDPRGYSRGRRDPDQAVREAASKAFFGRLKTLDGPLGLLMSRRLTADLDLAHIRNFADPIDAFFYRGDGIPIGGFRKIAEVARAHRETAARHVRLVGRVHGLSRVGFADLYAPTPAAVGGKTISFEEAVDSTVGSWAAMGPEYQNLMRTRLAQPWIDWRPRANKNDAGVYWQVGGGHPYTVLTLDGGLSGSKTFAGAASLMMFYASLPPEKTPERRDEDWPVYGNAVWLLGQMLHDQYLLEHAKDRSQRIAILYDDIFRLWSSSFQLASMVDLEENVYASIDQGRPLSGSQIATAYASILRDYYPAREGGIPLEDGDGYQALVLGNTYYGQVLAEWAIAMASAAAMAERLEANDPETIAALAHPMARPGSFTSYDLLRDAGVDLATGAPYEALYRRMNRLMDALERELAP